MRRGGDVGFTVTPRRHHLGMPSTPRRESTTGIHHVMNRGVDHGIVFFDDEDRIELGRRLGAIHRDHEVSTLAYCLMDNHFHLLVRAPPGRLSPAMQHLESVYTRHTNERIGRDGPMFRGRFRSIPVETDPYLMWVTRYIHRNPLVIPGVRRPATYRWSSYRAYLGLRPTPSFLDLGPVLSLFAGRRDELMAFTEDVDHVPGEPQTVDDLRPWIDCAIAIDQLSHPVNHGNRFDRTVLAVLADRDRLPRLRAVLQESLGSRSAPSVHAAARRARKRFDADDRVQRVVAWLEEQLAA
jgi:REP element-mobilizing transposase RayT